MTAQPFKHDFKKGNVNDLNRAFGYTQALNDVFKCIRILSLGGDRKRIYAIALLERIEATNEEIMKFTQEVTEQLEEQLRKEMSIPIEDIKDELP